MPRLLRPRRGVSPLGMGGGDAPRTAAGSGYWGGGGGIAPAPRCLVRRRQVQCMLLLHATWLVAPTLLMAASILGRQHRHELLAQRLLDGSNDDSDSAVVGLVGAHPANFASAWQCGEALQLPQIALLFLVKGPMHHETLWRLWFQAAGGMLPQESLATALCSSSSGSGGGGSSGSDLSTSERQRHVLQACSSSRDDGEAVQLADEPAAELGLTGEKAGQPQVIPGHLCRLMRQIRSKGAAAGIKTGSDEALSTAQCRAMPPASGILGEQLLFDVYVHPQPSFEGYPPGSLFHGRDLPRGERVTTEWGQHSLVDAARALLRAAHRNPRNTKFVLLSESDLPLYSPALLYTQLLSEPLSRLNACNTTNGWRLFDHRWVPRMESRLLKEHHWRKSWQWFALARRHVGLVLADTAVDASFRAHCRTMFEPERDEERECYSDEHYIPTLLAVHGRDNETDCQGWLMDTDWSRVDHLSPHPWEYLPEEVTDTLLHRLRHPELPGCWHAAQAAATASGAFVAAADLAAVAAVAPGSVQAEAALAGMCRHLEQRSLQHQQQHLLLGPRCRLVARKFLNTTQAAALAAVAPCDSRMLIINNGTCPGETPRQAALRRAWQQVVLPVLLALGNLLLTLLAALGLGALGAPAASGRHGARR